jgi:glyoxylase-like metal-dependent hydrolase (beta-lactamase superfamily II)
LRGQAVAEHALTHAHADHQGASHRVCTELGIPLAVGESDVPAMEGGPEYISSLQHPGLFNRMQKRFWTGPQGEATSAAWPRAGRNHRSARCEPMPLSAPIRELQRGPSLDPVRTGGCSWN